MTCAARDQAMRSPDTAPASLADDGHYVLRLMTNASGTKHLRAALFPPRFAGEEKSRRLAPSQRASDCPRRRPSTPPQSRHGPRGRAGATRVKARRLR